MKFAQKCHFSLFWAVLTIYMNGLSIFSAVFFHARQLSTCVLSFLVIFWRLFEILVSGEKLFRKISILKIFEVSDDGGSKKIFCPKSVRNDPQNTRFTPKIIFREKIFFLSRPFSYGVVLARRQNVIFHFLGLF